MFELKSAHTNPRGGKPNLAAPFWSCIAQTENVHCRKGRFVPLGFVSTEFDFCSVACYIPNKNAGKLNGVINENTGNIPVRIESVVVRLVPVPHWLHSCSGSGSAPVHFRKPVNSFGKANVFVSAKPGLLLWLVYVSIVDSFRDEDPHASGHRQYGKHDLFVPET